MSSDEQIVYTDGSCKGNGKGASARAGFSAFFGDGDPRNVSEPISDDGKHTNQVAELTAVLVAFERSDPKTPLLIVSDSTYCVDGLFGRNGKQPWYRGWLKNGWRNAKRKPVENRALWERLISISKNRRFRMKWQRGHSGNFGNDMADKLAQDGASLAKRTLKKH